MRSLVLGIAAVCLCAATLGTSPAQADGGVIRFVGAVYAPTCGSAADRMEAKGPPLMRCHGPGEQVAAQRSSFSQHESPLREHLADGNPVLDYFNNYLPAEQREQARLVTRTYL